MIIYKAYKAGKGASSSFSFNLTEKLMEDTKCKRSVFKGNNVSKWIVRL